MADWYFRTGGNDGNAGNGPGTGAAFQNWHTAYNAASAGDTIWGGDEIHSVVATPSAIAGKSHDLPIRVGVFDAGGGFVRGTRPAFRLNATTASVTAFPVNETWVKAQDIYISTAGNNKYVIDPGTASSFAFCTFEQNTNLTINDGGQDCQWMGCDFIQNTNNQTGFVCGYLNRAWGCSAVTVSTNTNDSCVIFENSWGIWEDGIIIAKAGSRGIQLANTYNTVRNSEIIGGNIASANAIHVGTVDAYIVVNNKFYKWNGAGGGAWQQSAGATGNMVGGNGYYDCANTTPATAPGLSLPETTITTDPYVDAASDDYSYADATEAIDGSQHVDDYGRLSLVDSYGNIGTRQAVSGGGGGVSGFSGIIRA